MRNILVIYTTGFEFTKDQEDKLTADFPQCGFTFRQDTCVDGDSIKNAEVIVGFPKPELVKKAENLKWLHLSSIGVDKHIDKSIYQNEEILLTNSSGTYGKPISDHVLGLMIMLARNLHFFRDQQAQHLWNKIDANKDLFHSTLCIIGLGDIGKNLAVKAKALGMKVIGIKRTAAQLPGYLDELYTTEALDQVLPQADFVVLSLATTKETVNLMSRERLGLMRKDAYLINIGRGALLDQEALYDALNTGSLAGAAIDVTTPEPLPEDSKLWGLKNLIITPHVSGKSPTTCQRQFSVFYHNLERYLSGKELDHVIDFDLMY